MTRLKQSSIVSLLVPTLLCGLLFIGLTSAQKSKEEGTGNGIKKASKNSLIIIGEDSWEQLLTGEWMVEFHAPWCPACRALQPEWKTFSGWSSDLGIKVGAVDVTANPGLSGRFLVTALPTIYHVKDGVFRQYKGSRESNTFVNFIEEKKWQSIEPVTNWKSPDSIQMSLVSYLFKISMALRSVHNSLVEDYGIPYWGSYIVFAFATILFGAILGLLIVCVIDLIWPVKTDASYQPLDKQTKASRRKSKNSDDDDNVEDDNLEDDIVTESESNGEAEVQVAEEHATTTDDDQKDEAKSKLRKRRPRRE